MITSPRQITDGTDHLVENVLIEPRSLTLADAEAVGFKQFACQIGEKIVQQGNLRRSEPVCFEFNAPTYDAAFIFAREHRDEAKAQLRKQANAQRARNALITPPMNGEIDRMKLHPGK